jgi:ACS family hexuronate transporter-like MFS transporter
MTIPLSCRNCSSLLGVLLQFATGVIVQVTHSYVPLFVLARVAYLTALLILHLISPKLEPVRME